MFKKFISLASMVAILGTGTLIASADELNTYSPETGELPYQGLELELGPITYDARTSRSSVNYSTSGFRNYVEPKTSFKSSGTQSITNGFQQTKTFTASTGIQYQITTQKGSRLKYVTKTGVYNGNLTVDLTHSGTAGENRKLRLANYYNLSFNDANAPVQSASGVFNY